MSDINRLLDTIDDPEIDYYFYCVDLLETKGINYNTYEKKEGVISGTGFAKDLVQTMFIHKYFDLRKILATDYVMLLFQDDIVECKKINRYTFNVKLITKGPSRLHAERHTILDTNKFLTKLIDDFIDDIKFHTIFDLTKKAAGIIPFYKSFCSKEDFLFISEVSQDAKFRTIDDDVERKYTIIHNQAIEKVMEIKDQLTSTKKRYTTAEYYSQFDPIRHKNLLSLFKEEEIKKIHNYLEIGPVSL